VSPRFSIVTPVYDTPADVLRTMVASVVRQSFGDWELCLVDDCSPAPHVWPLLGELAASDPRIRIARRAENGGISRASNDAVAMARGEFVVLVDHDDWLVREALSVVNHALTVNDPVDYAYSDEAKLLVDGTVGFPFYKPDWSPERLRSQMYTCHLSAIRRTLVEEVGGFRPEFDGSQDHDLVLRVTERTDRILHVPEMLYLWRMVPGSAAAVSGAKPYASEAGRRAVQAHCDRVGIDAEVEVLPLPGHYRVRRALRWRPLVSVVIPSRGSSGDVRGRRRVHLLQALASVLDGSTYDDVEVVLVLDRDTPPAVVDAVEARADARVRIVWFDGAFNFSAKVNRGVAASSGEVVLLLNDDVEVITPDWIETMLGLALDGDVGMVGCKLFFGDGTLQHGGHVYVGGKMLHSYVYYPGWEPGMSNLLGVERECSGVTAACAMLRREVWEEVGGMTERLPVNYNDVDLSLKVRDRGYRVLWTPHAQLYHYESSTRVVTFDDAEHAFVLRRWGNVLRADPYSNPNLDQTRCDWVVAKPPEAWLG